MGGGGGPPGPFQPPGTPPLVTRELYATSAVSVDSLWRRLSARCQRTDEEAYVGRAFGQPAHQVPVPLGAQRHVHADVVPELDEAALLIRADPVEHLELELVRRPVETLGPVATDRHQTGVVRRHHRVALA